MSPKSPIIEYKVRMPRDLHRKFKAAVALDPSPYTKSMRQVILELVRRYTDHQSTLRR